MRFPRILIIEDEIILRKYIVSMLLKLDCKIVGETSFGEEALAFVEDVEPDLILMDIRLKGHLDGFDTARQINQNKEIPIAFISAYNYSKKVEKEDIPGSIGFLNKPPEREALKEIIDKIRKRARKAW